MLCHFYNFLSPHHAPSAGQFLGDAWKGRNGKPVTANDMAQMLQTTNMVQGYVLRHAAHRPFVVKWGKRRLVCLCACQVGTV